MQSSLADSGLFVALFDRSDKWHGASVAYIEALEGRLITTWPVIAEVCAHLAPHVWIDFLEFLQEGQIVIADLQKDHLPVLRRMAQKYLDRPMDMADASLVLAAELYDTPKIATVDGDFDFYRFGRNRAFQNVLRPYVAGHTRRAALPRR